MTFAIDKFLEVSGADKDLRQHIVEVHDDLHTACEIINSVASSTANSMLHSDRVLTAVFHQVRAYKNQK